MSHCIHFGTCGGCAVENPSAFDKPARLRAALGRAGYENLNLATLVEISPGSRRRVDFAARREQGGVVLGLHRARSTEVVNITMCALLAPQLVALLAPLKVLLRGLESFRRAGSVIINLLDMGPDILLRLDAEPTQLDRQKIIAFARAHGAVRICTAIADTEAEPVIVLNPPVITLSGVKVEPPPGAFLQPSPDGEAAIISAVLNGLPKLNPKSKIIELYAGIGTLSFALAAHGRVDAYEGAVDAVVAHELAVRRANLAGRMNISMRDLARRPLMVPEMAKAAALVLDPPYAGLGPQLKNICAAAIARIVYVSCNPDALSNDAAALRRTGYQLLSATPIDQFSYSDNLETVAVFARA